MNYPIYTPDIQPYTKSIQKAIADGWISSQGEFLERAKQELSRIVGTPYVVLVNNGTSATHLLYKSLKFKHPNIQRIYVPDYVFVAVWNCALYEYSSDQIVVLPTDPVTLNPVIPEIEPNSALVVVHNIGNVVNVPELLRKYPDLVIVEDCCEAFLEEYEGRKTGTASLCAAVSFFGNKLVTTGEGGAWYTNDKELYEFIHKSCHHGMTSTRYVYDVLGYNYRMTNLQAAFLYDQLQMVDRILQTKTLVRNRYRTLLPGLSVTNGLWMNVVRVPNGVYADIESKLRNNGIDTRPMFYPIGAHAHLSSIPATSTEIRRDELVMIPSSPSLTVYDQVYIASVLKSRTETLPTLHRIIAENRHLLDTFVSYDLPPTFRYFASRTVDGCLSSHTLTLVGTKDDRPVCYAHLEDRWIGICVLPEFQGSGYGSFLLRFLLDYAEVSGISPLRLTVDKSNDIAYRMYVKHGFSVQEVTETICRMIKNDSSSSVHR